MFTTNSPFQETKEHSAVIQGSLKLHSNHILH